MGYLPHPTIPLGVFRPMDVLLLLVAGAVWETILRAIMWTQKAKPTSIKLRELKLKQVAQKAKISRAKGPQAFVETSKLERQQLNEEKKIADWAEQRKGGLEVWQKRSKNLNTGIAALVLFVYYGVPLMEFTPDRIDPVEGELLTEEAATAIAESTMKAFMFPLSVVGVGAKISKFGLASPKSSVGALLVFWSAQTTVGKIIDGLEALGL